MTIKLYKDSDNIFWLDNKTVVAGEYRMIKHSDTEVSIVAIDPDKYNNCYYNIAVTDIQDETGTGYVDFLTLRRALCDFFVKASSSASSGGLTPEQDEQFTEAYTNSHVHVDLDILDLTTASFTTDLKDKLDNLTDSYKGLYENEAAINSAFPSPEAGYSAWNNETETMWGESTGVWYNTNATSLGDMLSATYDPNSIKGDAFDFENMSGDIAVDLIPKAATTISIGSYSNPVTDINLSGNVSGGNGFIYEDETTGLLYKLIVDNGAIYLEEL